MEAGRSDSYTYTQPDAQNSNNDSLNYRLIALTSCLQNSCKHNKQANGGI